jgi:hypothetical protein
VRTPSSLQAWLTLPSCSASSSCDKLLVCPILATREVSGHWSSCNGSLRRTGNTFTKAYVGWVLKTFWPFAAVGVESDGSGRVAWDQQTELPPLARVRHRESGLPGLNDRRLAPSLRRALVAEIERMLGLYRELYRGFTVQHFHEQLRKRHNYVLGDTVTKLDLHREGLVARAKKRLMHRKKRPRRPMVGMILHHRRRSGRVFHTLQDRLPKDFRRRSGAGCH